MNQGSGHVVRALTLAKEFEQNGHEVKMIGAIQEIPWLTELIESSGINWQETRAHRLDLDSLLRQNFDLLVVDSYEISADVINSAAEEITTLAIVDNQTRGILAQYLLDHNVAAIEYLPDPRTQQLIGPKFALVRKEMRELRRSSSSLLKTNPKPNVLVMFGGTDPRNFSLAVSEMMGSLDEDFDINFVVPDINAYSIKKNFPENRYNIHKPTPKIQNLLARADLVFSAAGTSVLDISCIGIPSIYVSTAENQNPAIDAVAELRLGIAINNGGNVGKLKRDILEAVKLCAFDQQLRGEFFTNSQELVDGLGAQRVVQYIEQGRTLILD